MCGKGCRVGIIIYVIVQFIAFLFYLVGTPIDMYRRKDVKLNTDTINAACLTLWGQKTKCLSATYPSGGRTATIYEPCSGRKTRFQAAEAFSIITIILMLLAVIFGFIQLCCCRCLRWFCLILNILALICGIIPWAIVADSYSKGYKIDSKNLTAIALYGWRCSKFNSSMKYGAGFALLIVGWALGLLAIIPLMLPC